MKRVAELVVRVADLIEAEGRALLSVTRDEAARAQRSLARMFVGMVFLGTALPLFVLGMCLVAWGMMLSLQDSLGAPAAAMITGLFVLGGGGACVWIFQHRSSH